MAVSNTGRIVGAVAAAAVIGAAIVGVAVSGNDSPQQTAVSASPVFVAGFDNPTDFVANFDYGYSGIIAPQNGIPTSSLSFRGDHDASSTATTTCGAPTTFRNVTIGGTPQALDFSQLFYWCAPGGTGTGHLMTVQSTLGYNIAWFSPKGYMTDVSKVCWDINETAMSRRKWTQVLFVSPADAVRYPAGGPTGLSGIGGVARGTGGFDLGFTNPDFRSANGPTDGIFPAGGTLAGIRDQDGTVSWFDQQDIWQSQFVGPGPPYDSTREQTTDKGARYTHCIEQTGPNVITYTKATPTAGTVTRTLNGTIPQGQVRVVFEDDEYDGPKDSPAGGQPDGRANPDILTWHWDNLQVFAGTAAPPPSTTVPPVTTTLPSSTTQAPTTTVRPTTTTAATTTTQPPSSTTTIGPIPACPAGFTPAQTTWCLAVNAHIAALEAKVG